MVRFFPTSKPRARVFKCKHCDRKFKSNQKLGGHTKSQHSGLSITYQLRMARWHERTNERRIHQISKELYTEIK